MDESEDLMTIYDVTKVLYSIEYSNDVVGQADGDQTLLSNTDSDASDSSDQTPPATQGTSTFLPPVFTASVRGNIPLHVLRMIEPAPTAPDVLSSPRPLLQPSISLLSRSTPPGLQGSGLAGLTQTDLDSFSFGRAPGKPPLIHKGILFLLLQYPRFDQVIRWLPNNHRRSRTFEIKNPKAFAYLWSQIKRPGKSPMKWNSVKKSLEYHDKKKLIFERVCWTNSKKRHVYCFCDGVPLVL